MPTRNSARTFGWPTLTLHWVTAALVIGTLPFGKWIAWQEPSMALIRYYVWHKSAGLVILALLLLRLGWHLITPPPAPLPSSARWKDRTAEAVHTLLYILLFAVPISGWWASSATGIDTLLFGAVAMPRIAPVSETFAEVGFTIHGALATGLAALVILHIAGALTRSDGTLRRIMRGRVE